MGLVDHARRELHRAGLFDADSDYGGMLGHAVVSLMQTFAAQGHSGMSASIVLELFGKLARYDVLTPITSDPAEWQDVSEFMGRPCWQSTRKPALFSEDGGKTWHDVNERKADS